jgi:hypothetical protein
MNEPAAGMNIRRSCSLMAVMCIIETDEMILSREAFTCDCFPNAHRQL